MDAVSADRVVARACADPTLAAALAAAPVHLVAVGKAAASMAAAFLQQCGSPPRQALAIGTHRSVTLPPGLEWCESSHPFPDVRSVDAATRALAVAAGVRADELLLVLLSGGASSLMAAPVDGLTLDDKVAVSRTLMSAGADIDALNTVRKHLSQVKGGRLAAACAGTTVTLAISDVVGDNLSVIGSGPAVPDPTTWADVAQVIARFGTVAAYPAGFNRVLADGLAGRRAETPKPDDARVSRVRARVVGSRRDALVGARGAAERLGYRAVVLDEPVIGEARQVAPEWLATVRRVVASTGGPVCVLSAGETTVAVSGRGKGGRNLEFVLSLAGSVQQLGAAALVASAGTDGIDGSSGVAGGYVDASTMRRAHQRGLGSATRYLDDNDSFGFLGALGDVIRLGRTDTNVGDIQVALVRADGDPT